jgi:hypothetical protein
MALLPRAAFIDYPPGVDIPSPNVVVSNSDQPKRLLDLNVFNDVHFLDAAHTFQDQLFSGWFTAAHRTKLDKYLTGIRDGTLAAPWKDETWEQENPRPRALVKSAEVPSSSALAGFGARARAGYVSIT